METAEQVDCPAPLPEGPADALLTEMLVPAPYKAPEKKAEKKAPGTRKGLRRKVVPEASSEDDEAHSSPEGEEEEEEAAPSGEDGGPRRQTRGPGKALGASTGVEKRRKAAPEWGAGSSKKGKVSLPDYSATAAHSEEGWLPRGKPLARS